MGQINHDIKKLLIVNISEVRPNTWNPKDKGTEEYLKVKKSVQSNGQTQPVIVRQVKGIDGYEIVDGEQRFTACSELGHEKVLIYNEGYIDDKKAKELTIWYQTQVPFNEVELASVIKDLVVAYGMELDLPYSELEVTNMIKLNDFNWDNHAGTDGEMKEKEPKRVTCPSCGHEFEV